MPALQYFLQQGFGVFGGRLGINGSDAVGIEMMDDLLRPIEIAVEQHRAKNGFQRIGQNRRAAAPAAFYLAIAQAQKFTKFQFFCNFEQALLAYQICPQPG